MSDTLKLDPEQMDWLKENFTDALERALVENERLRVAGETNYRYYVALITQLRADADTLRTQLEALRGVNQTLADRLAGLEAFADTHRCGPVNEGELTYGDSIFDPSTANKVLVMPPALDVCRWWEDNDAADSEHAVWMTECGNCNVTTLERGDESRLAGARYCLFCGKQIKVEESE